MRPSFDALGCRVSIVSLDKFTNHLLAKVSQRQASQTSLTGPTGSFLQRDRERVDRRANLVLHDVFPRHVAEALVSGRKVEPEYRDSVTIFFSDVVGFTTISASLPPEKVSCMLDRLYERFDELSYAYAVFKVETIGGGRAGWRRAAVQ
jgi:class 3 adenylate cyclase